MRDTIWQAFILILFCLTIAQVLVLIGVVRQVGSISLQLAPAAHIGEIEGGPDPGTVVEVADLDRERPAIILFVSPTCRICSPLLPALPVVQTHYAELQLIAAVIGGDASSRWDYAQGIGDAARLDLGELETEWEVPGTPYAVAVGRDGRVLAKGVANSLDHLEQLAEVVVAAPIVESESDGMPESTSAHDLHVSSLASDLPDLAD